jgi:hypothetical protein
VTEALEDIVAAIEAGKARGCFAQKTSSEIRIYKADGWLWLTIRREETGPAVWERIVAATTGMSRPEDRH